MFKNQLQELAQRSCFNLPSYACIRQGPDHAPRFKSIVNFNGETFESPTFCATLRQAEHSAAEVALNALAERGPSRSLAARVLDETGVYKNLLQETVHRAGLNLPVYTTVRSGPGHVPVFTCTVELAGMSFTGEPAKTKKQAQKNAAITAWSSLKQLPNLCASSSLSSLESERSDEQEQVIVARALAYLCPLEAKRSSVQTNGNQGRRRSVPPLHRNTNLTRNTMSLYAIQCPSWAYSNLSPEVTMYQIWQQKQASLQQNRLVTFPVGPTLLSSQILPFVPSIFSDNGQYFLTREQDLISVAGSGPGPSLYFSNPSIPFQITSGSQMSIQEIQEERNIREEDSDRGKTSIQTDKRPEDQQKKVNSESCMGVQNEQIHGSHTSIDTGFRHEAPSTSILNFQSKCPGALDSSIHNLGNYHGQDSSSIRVAPCHTRPSTIAPVRIRSCGSMSNGGPPLQSLNNQVRPCRPRLINPVNFMAPAVQIRSVIPVCSAPPAKRTSDSSMEKHVLCRNWGNQEPEDVSVASSDHGKLRI